MRIGEFSDKNDITIDTVRHYMDIGLLVPEKVGSQYDFGEKEISALSNIKNLKDRGFSLMEIKDVFIYNALGSLTSFEQSNHFLGIYTDKLLSVKSDIDRLEEIADKLEFSIEEIKSRNTELKHNIGININVLHMLACSKCESSLMVKDAVIHNNEIFNGILICSECENSYDIRDGIIFGQEYIDSGESEEDLCRTANYIGEYMNEIHDSYLDNLYKNHIWLEKHFEFRRMKDKVVMDLGSGSGMFLRNIYKHLDDDTIYLAIDHDYNRHRFVKAMLERAEMKKNIVFMCCDFRDIPLKNKSVDVVVDITGTTNYAFDNKEFLLDIVDKYIKSKALIIGAYILFSCFDKKGYIDEEFRHNFREDHILSKIKELMYSIERFRISKETSEGGKYENFFTSNEKIYDYLLIGQRG